MSSATVMPAWIRVILYIVLLLVIAGVLMDIWSRLPSLVEVRPAGIDPAARGVVLLFHGRGGRDEPSMIALAERFQSLAAASPGTVVERYVWAPWSDTRFRSQPNGARVGRVLGEELAKLPDLGYIHLVGHSAGAYVLDPLCEAYRAAGGRARVEITYLDPIGFRGLVDTGFGARNYGVCADHAEAFINTDDPVPATNQPLRNAWNADVTAAPGKAAFDGGGHRWPVQYYADQLTSADLTPGAHSAARPRGVIEKR